MFPPPIPVAASTRDLVACGVLVQRDLVRHNRLVADARNRGVTLSDGRDALEGLDRDGVLSPLAFHIGSRTPATFAGPPQVRDAARDEHGEWESPGYVFRDEAPFRPWTEYAADVEDAEGVRDVMPLYSPWQLLALPLVEEGDHIRIPWTLLAGEPGDPTRLAAGPVRALAGVHVEGRRHMHANWLPTIKLLLRLQARYWPFVRGRSVMVYRPDPAGALERVDALDLEYAEATASDALEMLGVSVADVVAVYEWLCWRAESGADPAKSLRGLLRMLPRDRAESVRGDMLAALDIYDAAAMIRRFHRELTGDLLPEPDQGHVRGRDVKPRPLYRDRGALIAALACSGLTAHKLHVIAEGQTEVRLIAGLFERFHGAPADAAGVVITDLQGDKLQESRRFIEDLGVYARRVVLLLDDENEAKRVAEKFVADGIVAAEDVTLARPNLEEENFTADELVQMANELGEPQGVTLGFTGTQLEKQLRQRNGEAWEPIGMASMLVTMARDPNHGPVLQISKPELAGPMIDLIIRDIEQAHGGHDEVSERRPIVAWVLKIMLGAARRQ